MISKKIMSRSRCFAILAVLIAISIIALSRVGEPSSMQMPDTSGRQPVSHEKAQAPEPEKAGPENARDEKASSHFGAATSGRACPPRTLNGPEPDPVSEAYQQNDWKPVFIDSRFGLNQGARRCSWPASHALENHAIDPGHSSSTNCPKASKSSTGAAPRSRPPTFKAIRAIAGLESLPDISRNVLQENTRRPSGRPQRWMSGLATAFFLFAREMNPFLQKEECLKAISGEVPLSRFFQDLEPKTFNYEALVSAYAKYRKLAAQGAQQRVTMLVQAASRRVRKSHPRLAKKAAAGGFLFRKYHGCL